MDGQIVQVRQIPDEDLEIVPPDQQIPGMDVWLPPDQNLGKNMHIKMYGPGLDFDPVNDPARYVDKMITIPCFADTYIKNEELPFSYHPVLDEDGFVDNDESYISIKPYKRSARFFVLADVGFIAQNENECRNFCWFRSERIERIQRLRKGGSVRISQGPSRCG